MLTAQIALAAELGRLGAVRLAQKAVGIRDIGPASEQIDQPPALRRQPRLVACRLTDEIERAMNQEQATAIGIGRRLPAAQAAFMNGLLARSLEYDDMAMPDLHPSGVIAPVALAVGEWQGASGQTLLSAFVLGLELCLRIGRAGYDALWLLLSSPGEFLANRYIEGHAPAWVYEMSHGLPSP